jgi:hypothetical protein
VNELSESDEVGQHDYRNQRQRDRSGQARLSRDPPGIGGHEGDQQNPFEYRNDEARADHQFVGQRRVEGGCDEDGQRRR